eukprot:gene16808-18504_t
MSCKAEGKACKQTCYKGGCGSMQCQSDTICALSCPGGNCKQMSCDARLQSLLTCSSRCGMTCNSPCNAICSGQACNVDCRTEGCDISCNQGDCVVDFAEKTSGFVRRNLNYTFCGDFSFPRGAADITLICMGNEATKDAKMQNQSELITAGRNLYDFIHRVNQYCTLYMTPVIQNAIQRYEQKWLPLTARHLDRVLAAPLDIEWVWYVHMMNPEAYGQDCIAQAKSIIDHNLLSESEREISLRFTQDAWNRSYPGEPFFVDLNDSSPTVDAEFRSTLTYDLCNAARQEMLFNYQVALPHYRDEKFLKEAVKRYICLFEMRKAGCPFVPYYDNGLIWHAHMAFPKKYIKKTAEFFGSVLSHTIADSMRFPGTPQWESVTSAKAAWQQKRKPIAVSGSMLRGLPPFPHEARNPDRYTAYSHKTYFLQPKQLQITNLPKGHYRAVVKCEAKESDITQPFVVYDSSIEPMEDKWTKKFNMENDEARFALKTERFYGLSVSLYKKIDDTMYECYVCTVDFPQDSDVGKKIDEFALPLCLKFVGFVNNSGNLQTSKVTNEFTGCFVLSCPIIRPGSYMLKLDTSHTPYELCPDMADLLKLPKIVLPYYSGQQCIQCSYNDFKVLGSLGDPAFYMRIVHCQRPKVSVVEITDFNFELIASAHTVDLGTLPSHDEVGNPHGCCSINKDTQRAMIIRSENSDWAVVRASWHGYRKFVDSGHLAAELFILTSGQGCWIPIQSSGPLKNLFTIDLGPIGIGKVVVDVEKAIVTFPGTVSYVPELLCLSSCISILFALCQVRAEPEKDADGRLLPYSIKNKKSYKLDVNRLAYVINAGLYCPLLPRSYNH